MQQKIKNSEKNVRRDIHLKLISFGFVDVMFMGNNPKSRETKMAGKVRSVKNR